MSVALRSLNPYLSKIAITGKLIKKMDISLLSTKAFPIISRISPKLIWAANPVPIPATSTTARTSSFKVNPTTIITIPISIHKFISIPPNFVFSKYCYNFTFKNKEMQ